MKRTGPDSRSRDASRDPPPGGRAALSDLPDTELLRRSLDAAPGDTRAFDELVLRHQGHIRANCRFMVDDPEAASDLAQETFVRAYFLLSSFEGRSSFRTWLRRIKVNQCLSHRERRRRRPEVGLEDVPVEEVPPLRVRPVAEEKLEADELRMRVVRVLDRIPESLRVPLVLRDMDGFSYEEIREMLKIGLSAVKMRILRGREAFRALWDEEGGGEG